LTARGRLYLAGAMSAGRDSARRVALIATAAAEAGWRVLSLPVVDPSHDFSDTGADRARRIFVRDMSWLAQCDALIAEISTPSHGVGFEIGEALRLGKPTLCLRDSALAGTLPSAMLVGNPSPLIACHHCADEGIAPLVTEFLTRARREGTVASPLDPRNAG
jgi:nucleoside 2-deoxyribosyltransferase